MSDHAKNLELMATIFGMDPRNKQAILSAAARIRELEALMDECERALIELGHAAKFPINTKMMDICYNTLAMIRAAQEQADE